MSIVTASRRAGAERSPAAAFVRPARRCCRPPSVLSKLSKYKAFSTYKGPGKGFGRGCWKKSAQLSSKRRTNKVWTSQSELGSAAAIRWLQSRFQSRFQHRCRLPRKPIAMPIFIRIIVESSSGRDNLERESERRAERAAATSPSTRISGGDDTMNLAIGPFAALGAGGARQLLFPPFLAAVLMDNVTERIVRKLQEQFKARATQCRHRSRPCPLPMPVCPSSDLRSHLPAGR